MTKTIKFIVGSISHWHFRQRIGGESGKIFGHQSILARNIRKCNPYPQNQMPFPEAESIGKSNQ